MVGIPVNIVISDGVTPLRLADFDDGPETGIVRITTVSLLAADGVSEYATSFRKARTPDLSKATLSLAPAKPADSNEWTLVSLATAADNNRPATLRLTPHDGIKLVTLKEVDFTDDTKSEWLVRNRETLTR